MMLATRKVPGLVEKQTEHERRPQDNLYHGDSSGHGNVVIHSFARERRAFVPVPVWIPCGSAPKVPLPFNASSWFLSKSECFFLSLNFLPVTGELPVLRI